MGKMTSFGDYGKMVWECLTCGRKHRDDETKCGSCGNPRGSAPVPFVLKVYDWGFMDEATGESGRIDFVEFTDEQLDKLIESGDLFEGCFDDHRCDSTWSPFISRWPERFQFLKTDGYTGPNEGHPEDF
jgi:hypothetical protein